MSRKLQAVVKCQLILKPVVRIKKFFYLRHLMKYAAATDLIPFILR